MGTNLMSREPKMKCHQNLGSNRNPKAAPGFANGLPDCAAVLHGRSCDTSLQFNPNFDRCSSLPLTVKYSKTSHINSSICCYKQTKLSAKTKLIFFKCAITSSFREQFSSLEVY